MGDFSEWDSNHLCIGLQIAADICAVPTVDAVATGEDNCYNCIVRFHSLRRFAETIGCSATQRLLAREDAFNHCPWSIYYRGILKGYYL